MSFEIDFEPVGRRVNSAVGQTILDAAQKAGVMLAAVCGGEGVCARCKVRVMDGQVSPPNLTETAELGDTQVAAGWRLACQTEILGDVRVHVPPELLVTTQRTQTEGQGLFVVLDPAVTAFDLDLTAPTIEDLRSDADRVRDALGLPELTFPAPVLRALSQDLRAAEFHPTVLVHAQSVVAIRPARTRALGLAVDIGTTKVAGYLVDLASGETLAAEGLMNPQIAFGEDVMARINHAITHPGGAEQLRLALVSALNQLALSLCTRSQSHLADIADAVVVGNTAIHHLFLGLSVKQLGLSPYIPAESAALTLPARDVGLDLAPGAYVHLLPNIAGFVGADHVAMLLSSDLAARGAVVLGMDIGTNTEISLVAKGRHWACSTASGPAFEGAHIRFGMRAAPGAIEKVILHEDQVFLKTVDDCAPVGLCGSGILDLVAQLRRAGLINSRGSFVRSSGHPRIRPGAHGGEFVVVPADKDGRTEITFSRADVNEVQLAKGAMRAGVEILLQHAGLVDSDIDEIVIAGAFGTYLDVQSGIDIGMFPPIDPQRCKQVGNAAGAGARIALLSLAQRERALQIARQVEYIELTTQAEFTSAFTSALLLEEPGEQSEPLLP